jgi:hypothetical protein
MIYACSGALFSDAEIILNGSRQNLVLGRSGLFDSSLSCYLVFYLPSTNPMLAALICQKS